MRGAKADWPIVVSTCNGSGTAEEWQRCALEPDQNTHAHLELLGVLRREGVDLGLEDDVRLTHVGVDE